MINLEIHHKGQSDYFDIMNKKFKKKMIAIKNSELFTLANKKLRLKALKRAFLREKKETDYNNF